MANDEIDPPLYCYGGLSNDEFAGWYAVSSSKNCNDFCFWKQPIGENQSISTKADPHQSTRTPSGAKWGCLMDATGDDDTWNTANEIYEDYEGDEIFPYLKCSRGAGQTLKSTGQELMKSKAFFWFMLWSSIFIVVLEIMLLMRRRRRNRILSDQMEEIGRAHV